MAAVFNHLGQCVTDLAKSRRFYEDVLDFTFLREINPPDEPSNLLLRLKAPIGLTACYLERDGLVLELLHFAGEGAKPLRTRERVMNEPGLTHISLSVDDIEATCRRAAEYGGEVLDDTGIGFGIFIRDPEGQLIELLPMAYRESIDSGA